MSAGEVLRASVGLCERCSRRDLDKEADLQETWALVGWEPFRHVWCEASDAPEDMRWHTCPAFEEMEGW